jgi:dipeptide transport system ATP-binding protein
MVPGLHDRPVGCLFAPMQLRRRQLPTQRPLLRAWQDGMVRCHYPLAETPLLRAKAAATVMAGAAQ